MVAVVDQNGSPIRLAATQVTITLRRRVSPTQRPNSFDDICVNDDIDPGVNTDARLEILVPAGASSTELKIRVSDWNGQAGGQIPYQMQAPGNR